MLSAVMSSAASLSMAIDGILLTYHCGAAKSGAARDTSQTSAMKMAADWRHYCVSA